jgi:hypothetical protein
VCVALLAAAVAIQNLIVASFSVLVILIAYAYSPRGYTVGDRSVLVRRLIGDVRVPLDDIQELRRAAGDDFQGCIRLWGSGGLFGYYGLFRSSKLGRSTWYVTDRSRAVVLIAGAKTVLFSADDVEAFLAAIREQAPIQGAAGHPVPTAPSTGTPWLIPLFIGILLAVPLGLAGRFLATGLFGYDPGPPVYTLTGDSLDIRDRFYPVTIGAGSTDIAGIRMVDLGQEAGWRPVLRVGGFANSHYQSGWYRAANGTRIRLYRARGAQRLVLLPPRTGDAPVLLQVSDPEQFAEQIRRDWAAR